MAIIHQQYLVDVAIDTNGSNVVERQMISDAMENILRRSIKAGGLHADTGQIMSVGVAFDKELTQ